MPNKKIKENRAMNTEAGKTDGLKDFMFPGPPNQVIRAKTREEAMKVYNKDTK